MKNLCRSFARSAMTLVSGVPVLLLSAAAFGQNTPKFEFAKPEEVKVVEWKAQIKGGFILTSGNSQTRNGSIAALASRKEGNNRLTIEGVAAYGLSHVLVPVLAPVDPANPTAAPVIVGLDRRSVETTNNWLARGRYDRFFTANNSGYVTGQAAANKIAGKSFFGGGQIGYSRQLLKSDMHLAVAEIGYDLSHERYVEQPGKVIEPVTIHSARLFVGETLKLSETTGFIANVEALFNLNKETTAISSSTGTVGVDAFKDTRLLGKIGMTTTVFKKLSVGLGFTLRYDQNPAPIPVPSGSPAGAAYPADFQPFAKKVDTIGEATLIFTFF